MEWDDQTEEIIVSTKSSEREVLASSLAENTILRHPAAEGLRLVWRFRDGEESGTKWADLGIPEGTAEVLRDFVADLVRYAYDRGFMHGRYGRVEAIVLGTSTAKFGRVIDDEPVHINGGFTAAQPVPARPGLTHEEAAAIDRLSMTARTPGTDLGVLLAVVDRLTRASAPPQLEREGSEHDHDEDDRR